MRISLCDLEDNNYMCTTIVEFTWKQSVALPAATSGDAVACPGHSSLSDEPSSWPIKAAPMLFNTSYVQRAESWIGTSTAVLILHS